MWRCGSNETLDFIPVLLSYLFSLDCACAVSVQVLCQVKHGDEMNYIVTQATDWYTASGQIGNSPSKKLQAGFIFESLQDGTKRGTLCHNVRNTNMWIPTSACKLAVEPPLPPVEPPAYEIVEMRRKSFDGGLSWTEWEYWGMSKIP